MTITATMRVSMKPQSVLDSTVVPTLHCFHINKGRLTTQLEVMHDFD